MNTKPTKAESLMRIRARRRICEELDAKLAYDADPAYRSAQWIEELVANGVDRRIVEKIVSEVRQKIRGIGRSARP